MKLRFVLALGFGLLVLMISLSAGTAIYLNSAPESFSSAAHYSISPGVFFTAVAEELEENGIIRSALFIRVLGKIDGRGERIKQGTYSIKAGMSSNAILDLLVEGKQRLYSVTIPEGYNARATGNILDEAGICNAGEFLSAVESFTIEQVSGGEEISGKGAEGFLFPDTYLFQRDFPPRKVVEHLVERFFSALEDFVPEYSSLGAQELYEKVILASIIEREYRRADEAAMMASVFENRLERGMPLQSCATVVHVLVEEQGRDHPERLTYRDLEVESPYNTYIHTGLPPAPIANPGTTALKAAFFPGKSDYLFFALKNPETGEHVFTKSYQDHDAAYQLYIKKR